MKISSYQTLKKITPDRWDLPIFSNPLLDYDFLSVVEESEINSLQHFYYQLFNLQDQPIGRVNAYRTLTDFATLESGMSPTIYQIIKGIKKLYPRFLAFNMLECGFFTTLGEGLEVSEVQHQPAALQAVAQHLETLTKDHQVDFLFFRDISLDSYETYKRILTPMGYLPTLGFPNAILEVKWDNLQDFLKTFNSKDRRKLKNSLLYEENFKIECKIIQDYKHLCPELANLWKNVHQTSKDYSREVLTEKFFYTCNQRLQGQSEVITFWFEGKIVAFMLNIFSRNKYFVLDWGVDYNFKYYRQSNLYRATTVISVKRAMKYKKKQVVFGITNYVPKKLIGATIHPLVYFIKHRKNPILTYILARSIMNQIVQPDYSNFWETYPHLHHYQDIEERLRRERAVFLSNHRSRLFTKSRD